MGNGNIICEEPKFDMTIISVIIYTCRSTLHHVHYIIFACISLTSDNMSCSSASLGQQPSDLTIVPTSLINNDTEISKLTELCNKTTTYNYQYIFIMHFNYVKQFHLSLTLISIIKEKLISYNFEHWKISKVHIKQEFIDVCDQHDAMVSIVNAKVIFIVYTCATSAGNMCGSCYSC